MRTPIRVAFGLITLATGAAQAAPYPASSLIAGLTWNTATYQSGGRGGDIWPVTWGADGRVHTAWGDGQVGCPAKVSYGTAAVAGGPSATLATTGCGPLGMKQGKIASLLDVGGVPYAIVNLQNRPWPRPDFAVWSSPDGGATWQKPAWTFPGTGGALRPTAFVNFGQGAAAPDGYVYMTAQKAVADANQHSAYLMRVLQGSLALQGAYRYFAGRDAAGAASWSASAAAAVRVFRDPVELDGPEIVRDAGLGRVPVHGCETPICAYAAMGTWSS